MLGSDYDSFENFKQACNTDRRPLHSSSLLGKIYHTKQIKKIIAEANLNYDELLENIDSDRAGIGRRYSLSDAIADAIDSERLGEILSKVDHSFYFQYVTFIGLPDERPYSSLEEFLKCLRNKDIISTWGCQVNCVTGIHTGTLSPNRMTN